MRAGENQHIGFDLLAEGAPEAYCAYAADYFQRSVDPSDVRHVFEHRALTSDLVRRLNPDIGLAAAMIAVLTDSVEMPCWTAFRSYGPWPRSPG